MVQVLQAEKVTLGTLVEEFGLTLSTDSYFFYEWQEGLPDLTEAERFFLNKIQAGYFNLVTDPPVLERPVQFAIMSPLLFLADFYTAPFQVKAEKSVEIVDADEDTVVTGSLDALILKERLWLLVIESKRVQFSIESGLAQLLAYMLANPHPEKSVFGMVTNGECFIFVKLVKDAGFVYATSRFFAMRNPGNELYDVLKILKRISQL